MSFYSLLHGISGVRRAVFSDGGGALIEGMGAVSADTERMATIGKAASQQIATLSQALQLGACKMIVLRTETAASALVFHDRSLAILDIDPKRFSPEVEKTLESRKWSVQPVEHAERPGPQPARSTTPVPHSKSPAPYSITPAPYSITPTPYSITPTPHSITPALHPVSAALRSVTPAPRPTPTAKSGPIGLPRSLPKGARDPAPIEEDPAGAEAEWPHVSTLEMFANDGQTTKPRPQPSPHAADPAFERRPIDGAPERALKRRLSTTAELGSAAGDETMFAGSLRMVSFPDLLEFCRNGRRTGVLFCRHEESAGSVTVQLGRVLRAEAPKASAKSLLACLQERGAITADKVRPLGLDGEDQDVDDETVGKLLVEAGLLNQETIQMVILERIQSAIGEMLEWVDGTFAFHPTEQENLASDAAGVDPQCILLQIFKMKDEQERDQRSE